MSEKLEKIDRYELLRKLATGGMADIFLAKQSGLEGFEKVVVIKRILTHLAEDEEFVSMFLDEARIAAKLSHPNIVQIYDLGKADETYYIAMEYVSGRNVQHLLNKEAEFGEKIPVEHVCKIISGVCDGLHYAHSRRDYNGLALNIVHRDISPQNILVSFAGGVKVVDFGIAKASTKIAQTKAGVLKGKYAYMSPEQVKGQTVDHRSDIFSVGLVMYEMLTGRRAFERESSLKTLAAIVQEKPLNPRELNPNVPMEVVKLLSKALEKNPARRYENAQEMQIALEDYLETSAKKSSNVRISRYLKEIFDDELNADGGTLVVQGIGEIVIPTKAPDPSSVQEEVEERTVSKMLSDDISRESGTDEGELEDKTIPVYDLASYERQRYSANSESAEQPSLADVDSDAPTQTLNADHVKEIEAEARRQHELEEKSREKARAMLAKVESLADEAAVAEEWSEKTDFQAALSDHGPALIVPENPATPPVAITHEPAKQAPVARPVKSSGSSKLSWVFGGLSMMFLIAALAVGIFALFKLKSQPTSRYRQVNVLADVPTTFVVDGREYKTPTRIFGEVGRELTLDVKNSDTERKVTISVVAGKSPVLQEL